MLDLSIRNAQEKLIRKEISARELTEAALARIEQVEPRLSALLTVCDVEALRSAVAIDERRARGETLGPLAGIPFALKDNLCTAGVRTTAGSKILHNFVPPYDATVVKRLRQADGIVLAKANLDEFAMGSSTENSGFQTTRNPWRLDCVPGGSSGGSAAAVAAREALGALGSDTGGSIRQPAALCGVVGMKPTYGRVSRYGLIAYASSLDQIGPLGKCVDDCAQILQAIAGHDPLDSTCANVPVPDYCAPSRGVRGLKVGVPKEYFGSGVDAGVAQLVRTAVDKLVELGAVSEECSLPATEYALAAYYIIAPAEASSNLARFDGVKYGLRSAKAAGYIGLTEKTRDDGFGAEVKQRIMIGTYALSAGYYDAYYKRAQQVRTLIRQDFDRAFEKYDVLVTPTSPTTAFRIGEKADPIAMKLADICTLPVNMAGLPAISLPCGLIEGLPVGLQIIGRAFDEISLFSAARSYEESTDWSLNGPIL